MLRFQHLLDVQVPGPTVGVPFPKDATGSCDSVTPETLGTEEELGPAQGSGPRPSSKASTRFQNSEPTGVTLLGKENLCHFLKMSKTHKCHRLRH